MDEYELWVFWDKEPVEVDREPDARLVAPETGTYELRINAAREATLVRVRP